MCEKESHSSCKVVRLSCRDVRLAFLDQILKNLALFQVGWPKKFHLAFWPFFDLV